MKRCLLFAVLAAAPFASAWAEEAAGYLEPGRSIKISSAEPGVLQEVRVTEGQEVRAGDILARLDTRVLELEAKIAEEEYTMLSRRLERLRELIAKKFASEDELIRAESDLKITRLRKERTEAQIERLTLRSPIDGVVTELRVDVAESVPGANSHVATVVQLKPMRVQLNLPVTEALRLSKGQEVTVHFPDFQETRPGVVDFISPVSTAVVNTVRVKVILPDPGMLPAGTKCHLATPGEPALTSKSTQP